MRETQFVHRLPVSTPTLYPAVTTNVYLVENQGEAILIDAGYDDLQAAESISAYIQSLGEIELKSVVLTHHHKDHCPGAKHLAARYGCPILCHPLEAEAIEQQIQPYRVTPVLRDLDQLRIGELTLTILHSPGHTRGHITIWFEQAGILFTGDNIVGQGTTWIGPPDGDLIDYLATLERFQSLQPSLIAPGHGVMIRDPQAKIQFFIERRLQREQQILSLLEAQVSSVADLVAAIYVGQVHPSVMWVAERTIQGHLAKLVKEGRIRQTGEQYQIQKQDPL